MKNLRKENTVCLALEKTRKIAFLFVLAAGSLLLVKAIYALSGASAEDSGGPGSLPEAYWVEAAVTELMAGTRSVGTASLGGQEPDPSYAPTASELVGAVVANELTDREQLRKWICMVEKRAGQQTLTQVQVETKEGPLYRLLAINGMALSGWPGS